MESSPTILEGVIADLRALGPKKWPDVEEATGVSVHTIRKIVYRDRKNPGIDIVERLYSHLAGRPQ